MPKAAKKFGIPHSTLYDVFISGGSYQGSGRKCTVFTLVEEKNVANKVLEMTHGGQNLTWPILKDIMVQELELLMSLDPRRMRSKVSVKDGSLLNIPFVRRFAQRNDLSKLLMKRFTVTHRPHKCEVCQTTFSFKNALVKHMRSQHN